LCAREIRWQCLRHLPLRSPPPKCFTESDTPQRIFAARPRLAVLWAQNLDLYDVLNAAPPASLHTLIVNLSSFDDDLPVNSYVRPLSLPPSNASSRRTQHWIHSCWSRHTLKAWWPTRCYTMKSKSAIRSIISTLTIMSPCGSCGAPRKGMFDASPLAHADRAILGLTTSLDGT
jgi:hypothetical protein